MIDPARSFGAPVTLREGVQTRILTASVKAEGSIDRVADLYVVDPSAVRDAVTFESRLPE